MLSEMVATGMFFDNGLVSWALIAGVQRSTGRPRVPRVNGHVGKLTTRARVQVVFNFFRINVRRGVLLMFITPVSESDEVTMT